MKFNINYNKRNDEVVIFFLIIFKQYKIQETFNIEGVLYESEKRNEKGRLRGYGG